MKILMEVEYTLTDGDMAFLGKGAEDKEILDYVNDNIDMNEFDDALSKGNAIGVIKE